MFNNGYCWGLSVITGFGYVHVGKMEEGRVWWTPMQGHHVSMGSVMITFASLHSQQHSPRFAIIRAAATQSLLIKSKFYALKREKAALNSSLNFTMRCFTQNSSSQYSTSKFHLQWFTFILFGHSH
jgi:hypothetical protein